MSANPQPRLTPEQYLEIERLADCKHEYYNGRMFAMSGGSFNHARIISNLNAAIYNALHETKCAVPSADLRINASPDGLYTYADVVVICGEPEFVDAQQDTLTNPIVIAEVLSPSTEGYDRGFKFVQYRNLPALQEYLIVSQFEPRIEVFRRQPSGDWLLSDYLGMEARCPLHSIHCEIRLADVFNKIVFKSDDARTRQLLPQID